MRRVRLTLAMSEYDHVRDLTAGVVECRGHDCWPYGIEPNRRTLEAFLAFAHEQGVCHRPAAVEELFPPEVRSTFRR